jgi:hypothetical protein
MKEVDCPAPPASPLPSSQRHGSVYCDFPWYLPIREKLVPGWYYPTASPVASAYWRAYPALARAHDPSVSPATAGAGVSASGGGGAGSTQFVPLRVSVVRVEERASGVKRLYFKATGTSCLLCNFCRMTCCIV